MEHLMVNGIDFPLTPSEGSAWSVDNTSASVSVTATPHSDIFVDPGAGSQVNSETLFNAATLLGEVPPGDFQFRARVTVDFASTFDAGVLLLWISARYWAKLCFEYSPDKEPMVVSVVNRGVADDSNAFVVDGNSVWLRVSRLDNIYAYHASLDGTHWRMVRAFVLDGDDGDERVGFEAQSPTGEGCHVTFDHVSLTRETLTGLRDGS